MIPSKKNAANAVGGKTARACDNCVRKRARWYCAADDAFLCQTCDSSVHSANPLARRHERVRLISASSESVTKIASGPCWHRGITKKARTKRLPKTHKSSEIGSNPFLIVPEIGGDETNSYENNNEEKLVYKVPIYDPFVANYGGETINAPKLANYLGGNSNAFVGNDMESIGDQLGADVERLLGSGIESECCFDIEALGLIDCSLENNNSNNKEYSRVKLEEEDQANKETETEMEIMREPFQLNFEDYDCDDKEEVEDEKKVILRLDYESVITAWASQGSPWTTGHRPNFDCMSEHQQYPYGGRNPAMSDRGREARVSRYREKRRTRLFSKKIRYEVRKLNAEKRPRMKGRFVKRASCLISTS